MFPYLLSQLDHLRDDKRVRFIEQEVLGARFTIVSYMVADTDMWKLPFAKECRGIVYNAVGACVCAPFEKFFNLNENEWTQEEVVRQWGLPSVLFDKRDGSMITPVLVNGSVWLKTKKSFYSDVARLAQAAMNDELERFCYFMLNDGYTPIFEFTSRESEIVLNYGDEPQFVLLAARSMLDGSYMPWDQLEARAGNKIKTVPSFMPLSIDMLKDLAKTEENIEGWVLYWTHNNQRLKVKTDWYRALHHVKTDLRERDIAELIVDEKVDDIKSVVAEMGMDLKLIEALEHRVAQEIGLIEVSVDLLLAEAKQLPDRKTIAMTHRAHPHFGLMMKAYDGKEPDFVGYWKKNFLGDYTLKSLYNPNFGGDDG